MSKLNSKIIFTASSVAWSYGGIMYFYIKASTGSVILIDWGNGRTTQHDFLNEDEIMFKCDYFPSKIIPPFDGIKFYVEISGYDDCHIIDFRLHPMDMDAIDLDVTNCPELEKLIYCWCIRNENPCNLDLSRNTALKFLNCEEKGLTSLNLDNNTALEVLFCKRNSLSHLSLTNNFCLEELNCEYNGMKRLSIGYAPHLREAAFEDGNHINEATKMQIQYIIAENNAEKEM